MADLIDRKSLIENLNYFAPEHYTALINLIIEKEPTVDAVEVKHGTWYHGIEDGGSVYAKCSACGLKMNYSCYGYAYCALCGARMDGERKVSE